MRIIRTCREMGIETVGVFAEPDRRAPHVFFAHEAVHLQGPSPRAAYLDIEQILAAAERHGADAVHPGYGFLSENPAFADACAGAGIRFIGPSADSMRAMGDKVAARKRMCVSVLPIGLRLGSLSDLESGDSAAGRAWFHVLVPAPSAGRC